MNKVVLIVGASSGIGMFSAEKFIGKGDTVINMSRRECQVNGVINIACDVSNNTYMDKAWQKLSEITDRLDIFIYSAGFSMASPLEYVEEKDYRYLFDVNFFGYLYMLKKCIPMLKKSFGVTCVISSIAGIVPIAYDCFYSASKASVNMLTSALQLELMPFGIKPLCIMPGGTKTHFTFKRKEYPTDIVGSYATPLENATTALAKVEQGGMSAKKVALTVYRKCTKRVFAHTYASGICNKIITQLVRFLPQNILYLMAKNIYRINKYK